MSPSNAKPARTRRRWPWILVAAVLVLAVGFFFLNARRAATLLRNTYAVVHPTVGAIAVTVYGSGSLDAGASDTVYAPATGRVESLLASAGDAVTKGQPIAVLSSDALDARIAQLEASQASLDKQIGAMPFTTGSKTIAAPVAGRIMAVYASAGDPVAAVMDAHDALLVLSADGRLALTLSGGDAAKPGDAVRVTVDGKTVDGTVMEQVDGVTTVTVADSAFPADSVATVATADGAALGQGTLAVEAPVYVTASSGIVRSVKYGVGTKVAKGATLVTLQEAGYSAAFLDLVDQRAQALADLRDARAKKDGLTLLAPADGVLQALALVEKGPVAENQAAFTVGETTTFTMQVMVDELDIPGVQVGQTASLQIAAFPYRSFPATVERISLVGRASAGVTQYPVLLRIPASAGMKVGMSASVDIVTAEKKDALTIPIAALKVDGTRTYVTVVKNNGTREATTKDVDVTVGLANGNLVEILSGVTASDEVQLVDSSTGSIGGFFRQNHPTSAAGG